ncbi:MAG TPA: cytochrome c biogenesis protein CcsA [Verrucomicrobiae bacterium]|nr:cytochrome c biogenesis protein CcsA [Verrucomicrobiae bacterium]
MKKFLPWLVVGVFAAWVLAGLLPSTEKTFHTREFGQLPVLRDGRIQPLDSVARNSLRQLRNRQSVLLENGKSMSATAWLMETLMKPEAADDLKVFRIDNDEVKSLLKLPVGEKYFSFNQLRPNYNELSKEGQRIDQIDSKHRTAFENQTIKLYSATMLYQRLKVSLKPAGTDDFAAELKDYEAAIGPGAAAVSAQQQGKSYDTNAFDTIVGFLSDYNRAAQFATGLFVPPTNPAHTHQDWKTMGAVLMDAVRGEPLPPAVGAYAAMVSSYRHNQPVEFNQALAKYRLWLDEKMPAEVRKGRQEYAFNFFDPFYKATVIYVVALLAALAFWFTWGEWLRKSAFNLVVLAWVLHTIGLAARMYLERRPPVTNLYSSAVFIGWGSVILGMVLERIYRDGIGCVVAAIVGFVTQVIALNLAINGDTMEMMRAVLDSNFWLATHVVTVTLGYSAMFVAGLLAIIYVIRGVFTSSLKRATADGLSRMIYGIVCFATLFSFVGTVLGGIWADQSWGRFWGWDPKENGALLIVIWCAVILHARWGGLVRERGVAVLAILGNIITSWSWFGVNMLGVGLHSYGFMDSAFKWLVLFVASQLALVAVGLVPLKMWKSFQEEADDAPLPTPAPAK